MSSDTFLALTFWFVIFGKRFDIAFTVGSCAERRWRLGRVQSDFLLWLRISWILLEPRLWVWHWVWHWVWYWDLPLEILSSLPWERKGCSPPGQDSSLYFIQSARLSSATMQSLAGRAGGVPRLPGVVRGVALGLAVSGHRVGGGTLRHRGQAGGGHRGHGVYSAEIKRARC